MNREDVLKVDELKEELSEALQHFGQQLRSILGDVVYAVDTVIDRYNTLEAKHTQLVATVETLSERVLTLERLRGEH
jgi:ABC-type transporter Mla subunit MlaD